MSELKKWGSTSPSQLSTFGDCKRKWWRVSVNGERQPPTAAAERGSKIHAELEAYLIKGEPLSDGTARAMAQLLPFAGHVPEHAVEVGFTWRPDGWPVPIRGRVDLVDLTRGGDVIGITDHKTTGSLDNAKSERDLARDPQALLYSGAAFAGALEGVPAADEGAPLRFRLVYGTTRAPYQVREVAAPMSSAGVSAGLEMLAERARDQAATSEAQAWADVEPSYSACDKYGGCPFLSDCRAAVARPVCEVKTLSSVDDWFASLSAPSEAVSPAPSEAVSPAPSEAVSPAPSEVVSSAPSEVVSPAPSEAVSPAPSVYAINPPDGLPDGAPLPDDEGARKPKALKVKVGGELKAPSSLKVAELKAALSEGVAALSEGARAVYEAHAAAVEGATRAATLERLEVLAKVEGGRLMARDEAPEVAPQEYDLFNAPVPSEPVAASSEPVAPSSEPVAASSEPVAAAPSEPVAGSSEPVAAAPSEPVAAAPSEPVAASSEPVAAAPSVASRVLLLDCMAAGAVEGEVLLAPLIAELSAAHREPLALMSYARGWVLLGLEIQRRGWAEVFGGAEVVRFDAGSPIYRHASFALLEQASLVVRGSR
jgi:hypothetical protein